ncbi:MAG TPA: S41 family peptidase [Flavobacterium lutivivi]|nr:S41 family peptidase [Flavobacterium lutivivi]
MKKLFFFFLILLFFPLLNSCEDNDDNLVPSELEVNDFVWKGLNLYYLWQADVPDLADNRFSNQSELNAFLKTYDSPTTLFNHLRVDNAIDRFSVIFSDYTVLEGILTGNTKNNGVDYGIKLKPGSDTEVFGWVRYIIPNSDASTKDIQRGDIFYAINGIPLTVDNYRTLLADDTYTLNLANYDGGNITPNGQSVTLTKTELAENPIFINTVINQGSHNIGYLMYNGFYSAYDNQLNDVFGNFISQNVTDLVLDLRYNSGGSVNTATKLASMITGQFSGQIFAKQQWNAKAQAYYESNNPSSLINKFYSGLNGLNLNKVYVLTSKSTASASELVINCLKPYIEVIQIGDKTTGKNVGSVSLYDSPTYGKTDVNPSHKYAMQPIVLKIVDKNGFGDYTTGIAPTLTNTYIELFEDMGVLGNPSEPLLSRAINLITASGKQSAVSNDVSKRDFADCKTVNPLRTEMYLER